MKLLSCTDQIVELNSGSAVTIGNFDGVHCGHQALLSALHHKACSLGLPTLVVLFEPQPGEYFSPQDAPARLNRLREKIQSLHDYHVDYVYCLKFNQRLATMSPVDFANSLIFSHLNAKYLLLGEDFRFGHQRHGDMGLMRQLGFQWDCTVETYPDFCTQEVRISSTQIRQALSAGDLNRAAELMGRPYFMCGRVIQGQGIGRKWGVPTANIHVARGKLALSGVFAVQVARAGKPLLNGVANLGVRPTLDGTKPVLEVHLFDFDQSLYGEMLQVIFLHKLRDEMKFSSQDALVAQIHADVAIARSYSLMI